MAATYRVNLVRDEEGWWVASVPAVTGAHTQGRSIAQTMNRIREVLSLWEPGAEHADLIPVVHLRATARAMVRRASTARARADRAEADAADMLRASIRELSEREGLSTRDIAALLELSPSRVDQLKPRTAARTPAVKTPARARTR